MRPISRRLLKVAGWLSALLLILVGAAASATWFGGAPAAAWLLEYPVSTAIGRQIRVGGPPAVKWGAPTRITLNDIHVANAPWGSQPEMFSAQRLEIELFVRTLLFGPTRIPSIALDGAKLLLETSDHGEANWNFAPAAAAPKKRGEFPHIGHVIVHQSEIAYRNGETGAQSTLAMTDSRLDQEAGDAAGSQGGSPDSPLKVVLAGAFQSRPLKLDGTFGSIAELRTPTKPYPVGLSGNLADTKLAAEGTIKEPLDFDGIDLQLSLEGKKLHELADILGVPFPTLPDFRGTSKLSGGNGNWRIEALSVKTGASDLEGGLGLEIDITGKVPHVVAQLTAHASGDPLARQLLPREP